MADDNRFVRPRALTPGDTIAIVSPAGAVKEGLIDRAARRLEDAGYVVKIYPDARGRYGTFSAPRANRLHDLSDALTDPEVSAVLCARGGYGAIHLLEDIARLPLEDNPKWLIGFSDISALHALMWSRSIMSLHAPMAKHLAEHPDDDPDTLQLIDILEGGSPEYEMVHNPLNRTGHAEGRLTGGNLAVLDALVSTPYDMLRGDTILFIEDISEPVYKIERMLWRLRLNGVLGSLRGLIVGQFTGYHPEVDGRSMDAMISEMVSDYNYPVCYGFPIGHVDHNLPMIEGATVSLDVTDNNTILRFID